MQLFHAFAHDPDREVVYDMEFERAEWRLRRLEVQDAFSSLLRQGRFDSGPSR